MIANANKTFSADVKLRLHTSTQVIELGQLGPDFAILRQPQVIQDCNVELETIIDGESSRWPVRITNHDTSETRRIAFESTQPANR